MGPLAQLELLIASPLLSYVGVRKDGEKGRARRKQDWLFLPSPHWLAASLVSSTSTNGPLARLTPFGPCAPNFSH